VPEQVQQLDRLKAALADRYHIEREIGAGGMATVYLAHDIRHDRKVAIKVLKPELAAVLGAERFVQEIKTTANLQHPHILPLFDSGQVEGFLYYVMPYIEGETLRNKLDREKQLGIEEAVKIVTEVADALDYAHRHNVIHRDIKPENILLQDGRPIVADFGIALAVSAAAGGRMTETGLSLGTPHYMSPEQATAEKDLTNRSDTYSLGAVLYEMLTGDPPHTGSTAQQIIMKIVTDDPRPVTELRKSVPTNVAAAGAKALEKLPADRFASAGEFARALTDPAFTLPTTGAVPSVGVRSSHRWKRVSFGATGVIAALALVAIWGWLRPLPVSGPTIYDVAFTAGGNVRVGDLANFSVSHNGEYVVYEPLGRGASLWIRSLLNDGARPIVGTEGAVSPRLSPDGRHVAFVRDGVLQVMPLEGGAPRTLAEVTTMAGLRWLADGRILLGDRDGWRFRWIDPQSGAVTERAFPYCLLPVVLDDSALLCGGGGLKYAYAQTETNRTWLNVADHRDGASISTKLRGSSFRVIDDRYLTYMSADGALRATGVALATVGDARRWCPSRELHRCRTVRYRPQRNLGVRARSERRSWAPRGQARRR
jgi:serine/threonine-protein kinase